MCTQMQTQTRATVNEMRFYCQGSGGMEVDRVGMKRAEAEDWRAERSEGEWQGLAEWRRG